MREQGVTRGGGETVLRETGEGCGAAEPSVLIARAVDDWVREQLAGAANDGVLHEQLEAIVEAALFRRVLREVRGNQLEAARRLGVNRNTLRKRLRQLDIDPAPPCAPQIKLGRAACRETVG